MSNDTKTKAAAMATATAASRALRTASRGAADPASGRLEVSHLTFLCNRAADHLAMAHKKLFGDADEADDAIAHLDAALDCLKQLDGETQRAVRAPEIRRRAS